MELFNDTGFEVGDKVQVTIDEQTYYGTVIKINDSGNRIKVDYTTMPQKEPVKDWFHRFFWTKLETQKTI